MLSVPNKLGAITHPLVNSIYLKRDFGTPLSRHQEDVLVIETNFAVRSGGGFGSCMADLLGDLEDLQAEAEAKVGPFDRVDIRYH